MSERYIQVLSATRALPRIVKRSLVPAGYLVDSGGLDAESLSRSFDERTPDLFIVDADAEFEKLSPIMEMLGSRAPEAGFLLVARSLDNYPLLEKLLDLGLGNVIANHGGLAASKDRIDETELIATVEKLLSKDIFGIEKYLLSAGGIRVKEFTVEHSSQRAERLEELEDFLSAIDCYDRIQPMVLAVADELLMNAIFSAPRDAEGAPKYEKLNRREAFALEPDERVSFRYACDGRSIYVSVSDNFGSLDRDTLLKYLGKGLLEKGEGKVEEKEGGAGLGLYMVVHNMTQLVFNVQRQKRTEIIASFYVRGGLRAFRASGQSLNLFLID